MSARHYLILDLASAPIEGASGFLDTPKAPANYRDAEKIAAYIAEKEAEQREKMALDIDLARITAIGFQCEGDDTSTVISCRTEAAEVNALQRLIDHLNMENGTPRTIITFGGFRFDLPLLLRRCLYLDIWCPEISMDRFRSPHVDLWNKLSYNGAITAHGLGWYAKRWSWSDCVKPLSGAEEGQVLTTGNWAGLEVSVRHDVECTRRLAGKLGVL